MSKEDRDETRATITQQCEVLRNGAGYCDVGPRTQIEMRGKDRQRVLHGLCTNDTKRLAVGSGREAFLTNVQGKTLAYIHVFCRDDSLMVETVGGQAEQLLSHINHYIIREECELIDRSHDWQEVLVSGAASVESLQSLMGSIPPGGELQHVSGSIRGIPVEVRRVSYCSPTCFFLSCSSDAVQELLAALRESAMLACDPAAVEAMRIEMGTPVFGLDITPSNLPQEVGRDDRAISFTKGCYLGQETVARIDALGHVNTKLAGLRFTGQEIPPPGTLLERDDRVIARITSSCWSPTLAAPLALAYVRQGDDAPSRLLSSGPWRAEVVSLPIGN